MTITETAYLPEIAGTKQAHEAAASAQWWINRLARQVQMTGREFQARSIRPQRFCYCIRGWQDPKPLFEMAMTIRQALAAKACGAPDNPELLKRIEACRWDDGADYPQMREEPPHLPIEEPLVPDGQELVLLLKESLTLERGQTGAVRLVDHFAVVLQPKKEPT